MCAMIILFAFLLSLVINTVERIVGHHREQAPERKKVEESYAVRKSE